MSRPVIVGLALLFIASSSSSFAEPGQEGGRQKCGPPAAAMDACDGLQLDDTCSFQGRSGDELVGSCFVPDDAPDDAPIACRPDNHPEGRRR